MKRLFQLLTAGTMLAAVASAGLTSLNFDSAGGFLSGGPGSTVGWGFTIVDTTEYVLLQESSFCPPGSTSADLPCTSTMGAYTDFTFNAPVVGPAPDSPNVTQSFNLGAQLGLGSFHISPTAITGTVISGEIAIIYNLFTGDPTTDPNAIQIGGDNFISLPASITVAAPADVPEPGTILPPGLAMISLLLWRFRQQRAARKSDS